MKEIRITGDDGFEITVKETDDQYFIVCPYDLDIEIDGEEIIPNDVYRT